MAVEWKRKDIENIKSSVQKEIENHEISQTMLQYKLDILNAEGQRMYEEQEKELTEDSRQWSEIPISDVDAQGYINDHKDEEIFNKSYDEYNNFYEENKGLIYEYTIGMDTLEEIKVDAPNLKSEADKAIQDIERIDERYLKNEVTDDYKQNNKDGLLKSDVELEKYPQKYQDFYQSYHDGATEKEKAINVIEKYHQSYDEIKRDYSFQQIDLHSKFKADLNLVISGNDEALEKYGLEKGIDATDAYTEVGFTHMNRFTPNDYIERDLDLKEYDKATEQLESNPYGKEFINEIDNHNRDVFLNNMELSGKDKSLNHYIEKYQGLDVVIDKDDGGHIIFNAEEIEANPDEVYELLHDDRAASISVGVTSTDLDVMSDKPSTELVSIADGTKDMDALRDKVNDKKDASRVLSEEIVDVFENIDRTIERENQLDTNNIKGLKIEDMTFDYNNLKDEKMEDFTMIKDADVLDVQYNDNKSINIYSNAEEKAAINQYKFVDMQNMNLNVDEYMQYTIDRKNGVEQSKNIENKVDTHLDKTHKKNKKNDIEL